MLNFKWLNGLCNCIGTVRRRRRQSLLTFSERLEDRTLLTAVALASMDLSPGESPGSEDSLTAGDNGAAEFGTVQADGQWAGDAINFPDSFFELVGSVTADMTLPEVNAENIPESGDVSVNAVPDNHQIDFLFHDFLFHDEAEEALRSNVTYPALAPVPDNWVTTLPLIITNSDGDNLTADEDTEDDTAFPITSLQPLRTSTQHTRLVETLYQQSPPSGATRQMLIEFPLATPAEVARPDILLGNPVHQEDHRQVDTQDTDSPVPDQAPIAKNDPPEPTGDRTAGNEPDVSGRPDERRKTVINSLFENRNGEPGDIQQTAGSDSASSRPTDRSAPLRVSPIPLTADGELLLRPARELHRPAPPPLPEPVDDGSASALDPGVSAVVSATFLATVPAGWKTRLRRRLRYWQAVLA